MTNERRVEILSSDILDINALGDLLDLDYSMAAQKMRDIKRKLVSEGRDRLHIRGKILLEDYVYYFGLDINRYIVNNVLPKACDTERNV